MAAIGWRRRVALELRYDGPVPPWEAPSPPAAVILLQRMRLHRRLALEYAEIVRQQRDHATVATSERQRRFHHQAAERCRGNLAESRRAHSSLAAALGEARRAS